MDPANNILIPISLCGFVFIFFGLFAIYALQRIKNINNTWTKVAEKHGMSNLKPNSTYPEYQGRTNRVDIGLDVIFQQYTLVRSDSTTGISRTKTSRPWTRIYANLDVPPPFELRSRHQGVAEDSQYLAKPTGDAQFDQKYELFLPQNTAVSDVLTPKLKQLLLDAHPPVHIFKQKVFWSKVRIVTNTTMLENALQNCIDVASLLNQQSENN